MSCRQIDAAIIRRHFSPRQIELSYYAIDAAGFRHYATLFRR
jgi:hypothetical protein